MEDMAPRGLFAFLQLGYDSHSPLFANFLRKLLAGCRLFHSNMGTLSQDFRYGLRMLRKQPGFTAVAVITLALAIGANTAIFSIVYPVLLRPLPFAHPDQLVTVGESRQKIGCCSYAASYPDYLDWTKTAKSFESLAGYGGDAYTITGNG